jgi:glycine/D-amino acid oxidase-like deaminating enzyme
LFKDHAEITIIGGGIIGTAMAYYLAKEGRDVSLVEKRFLASEASGANGGGSGGYGAGLHVDLEKYRFSQIRELGRQLYSKLSDELGLDIEYRHSGGLTLIRPREMEVFQKIYDSYIDAGLNVKLLSPPEARRIEPELKGDIGGAVFASDRVHINPYRIVQGYGETARSRYNVKLYTNTAVTGIRLNKDRVEAVETDRGTISTKIVINAAGAWSSRIGAMAGCEVPIIPRRGQVFVTQAVPKRLNYFIGIVEATIARTNLETMEMQDTPDRPTIVDGQVQYRNLYGRQTAGGQILFGGRSEMVGLNKQVTRQGLSSIMSHVLEFFPGFEDMLVVRTWAGSMPYTPDGKPILGPAPGVEGFYLATGLCGGGLGTGAVLGRLMTNLINHGERPGLFDDTSITRFSKNTLESSAP